MFVNKKNIIHLMNCPNCGAHLESGQFCPKCGTSLVQEQAAHPETASTTGEPAAPQAPTPQTANNQATQNGFVDNVKSTSSNFGQFFMTLLKTPGAAQKANGNDMISELITLIIYGLLAGLLFYLNGGSNPEFGDEFFKPFLQIVGMLAIFVIATFGAGKLTMQDLSFQDTIAKYGAYTVRFLLVFAVAFLATLVDLYTVANILSAASVLGIGFIIPVLILREQPIKGFDHVYLMVILSIISIISIFYLGRFLINIDIINQLNSITDMFDF